MKTNKVTANELENVGGGIVEKTRDKTCGKCGSANLKKFKKSEGCKDVPCYHCNDCGYEDLWENSH